MRCVDAPQLRGKFDQHDLLITAVARDVIVITLAKTDGLKHRWVDFSGLLTFFSKTKEKTSCPSWEQEVTLFVTRYQKWILSTND